MKEAIFDGRVVKSQISGRGFPEFLVAFTWTGFCFCNGRALPGAYLSTLKLGVRGRGAKKTATYFYGGVFSLRNYVRQQYLQTSGSPEETAAGKNNVKNLQARVLTGGASA